METPTIIELVNDEGGVLAAGALARHLERMERRGQEPSGEYISAVSVSSEGIARTVKWPIPMPRREDNIVLGYD
jgi:hypothetical protein